MTDNENAQFDLVIKGGTCLIADPSDRMNVRFESCDVGVIGSKIAKIGNISSGAKVLEAKGLHVLPGVIDSQVHFREPGLEHKEDLATGTGAAVLGGVTTIFDMPNTRPATVSETELNDKLRRAEGRSWSNYAFFAGASHHNIDELASLELMPGCCGVKVFMGSSFGDLLLETDDLLERALAKGRRRVAVHAEDELRLLDRKALIQGSISVHMHPVWRDEQSALSATQRLFASAYKTKRLVHLLHVSTRQEVELLKKHKGKLVTAEVTPQHLTLFAPDCYDDIGTFAQMNPPIRDKDHMEALWKGVNEGVFEVFGSDHAPHTREEKAKPYPMSPSGMPGVQTLVPILLNHINEGRLTLERFVQMTSSGPASIYGIKNKGYIKEGYDADLTLIDLKAERRITSDWLYSRCGWSPFENMKVKGWPIATVVGGYISMKDDQLIGAPRGRPVSFDLDKPH